MKINALCWAVGITGVLVLAAGARVPAQVSGERSFSGQINDFSPSTVKGGPWEIHGTWALLVHERSSTADFSAALTMSDYGATPAGTIDLTQPGANGHTHHIRLTNAVVTWNMDGCPIFNPATKSGFQVNGTVSLLTGNGSNAPFETDPPSSTLQVCVTGGDQLPFSVQNSNLTLVFGGPATNHFGQQAIRGVVRKMGSPEQGDDQR